MITSSHIHTDSELRSRAKERANHTRRRTLTHARCKQSWNSLTPKHTFWDKVWMSSIRKLGNTVPALVMSYSHTHTDAHSHIPTHIWKNASKRARKSRRKVVIRCWYICFNSHTLHIHTPTHTKKKKQQPNSVNVAFSFRFVLLFFHLCVRFLVGNKYKA